MGLVWNTWCSHHEERKRSPKRKEKAQSCSSPKHGPSLKPVQDTVGWRIGKARRETVPKLMGKSED